MLRKYTHTLAAITKLWSTKVNLKCTEIDKIPIYTKKIVGYDVLLSHPNFIEIFITHAENSKIQIWGATSQN